MSHIVWTTHAAKDTPEGRLGISDLLLCLESQGCYLFPLFLSAFVFLPSSLLFLSRHFSAKCLFAGVWLFFFLYGSCWVARVWQVVCVAFRHVALVFAVKHLYKKTF